MTTVLDDREAARERENAELRRRLAACEAELAEARARETATAEVLQIINSSPGDLKPVFEAILDRAMRLCEAALGVLFLRDGERVRAAATCGLPSRMDEYVRAGIARNPNSRMSQGEAVEHIADLTQLPLASHPAMANAVELGGARTMLNVALTKDAASLGFFSIFRQEVRPFTERQIALLENFAAQAVIAMENARLLTETREALEQQTATAEVLQIINSSPGDLAPVFDAILEKAHALCGASHGALVTYDGEHFRAVATHELPAPFADLLRQPFRPEPGWPQDRLLRGERLVHMPDASAFHGPGWDSPRTRAAREAGLRALLMLPLRKDSRLLGYITANRHEPVPFTEKQIALLQNFAAQAVIAMENARLLTETREALEQQTATAEVLQVINSSPGDLAPVFEAMLDKAVRLCDAFFGALLVYDGEHFQNVAVRNVPAAFAEFVRTGQISFGPGTGPYRLLAGEPFVHILDGQAEEAYCRGDPNQRALIDLGGARTWVTAPLRKDDALLGAITVFRQEVRPFGDKQIALLQNFAAQAVIAMENARLLGELRARTEEIAAMNRELDARVAAQLDELERVGRLKRFLAPQLAEMIVAQGAEKILESHRRDIAVAFCDLRGFTAFAETAEPEEVLDLLREYHDALGPIVTRCEGTLDHFAADGLMVLFNDPLPCADAPERAVAMALQMREAVAALQRQWRRRGRRIGFGVGIAQGYATLGEIGFAERVDYTAIGTVCNLAARLCAEAQDGQILVSGRIAAAIEDNVRLEEIGDVALKGLAQAVAVYNVVGAEATP